MADEPRTIHNDKLSAEQIKLLDGAPVFDPIDLDACIVGIHKLPNGDHVPVYCYHQLILKHVEPGAAPDDEEAYASAQEWVDYNTMRAVPYMGDRSPIIVEEIEEEDQDEEPVDEEETFLTIAGKKWRVLECEHDLSAATPASGDASPSITV